MPGRNEMYFWYVNSNNTDQFIWQTKNGGSTWTRLDDDGITNCGDAFGGCGTEQGTYNLELAAVPDGEVTDLYAGTVNLYKCRITSATPTCARQRARYIHQPDARLRMPTQLWLYRTRTPNQHALSFLQINNNRQVAMYFATDGGIYRALDGYTGLLAGACGGTNQFDSLNENLGSITQFVSFSQHPTDPNTILAAPRTTVRPRPAHHKAPRTG